MIYNCIFLIPVLLCFFVKIYFAFKQEEQHRKPQIRINIETVEQVNNKYTTDSIEMIETPSLSAEKIKLNEIIYVVEPPTLVVNKVNNKYLSTYSHKGYFD